jgi:predicted permease
VSRDEAAAVNRIAFLVLQPALVFPLVASLDVSTLRFDLLGIYALCEAVAFAVTYLLCRTLLRRPHPEAWLLGMAVTFVNSLLYILPIAQLVYGPQGAAPITAVVALDATLWFAFFIITTDVASGAGQGTLATARRLAANPVLIAILAGVAFAVLRWPVPEPILTGMQFAGTGAAPMTLFALGVILSANPLRPDRTIASVSALKLFVFPALVWAALYMTPDDPVWNAQLVLNAAGPSGAMAFALAMLYGVSTRAIAPVIVWTSLISLVSLATLA